ncbi:MAG: hypothetical protein GY842_03250 [bacterium]|nr:hypothetical protein [bacterium]
MLIARSCTPIALLALVVLLLTTPIVAAPVVRNTDEAGTRYLGAIVDHDWGRPVTSGDLDGDGYDEVIVAASESYGTVTSYVYIMRGGPDGDVRGVIDLSSNGVDQTIIGATVDDNLGCSIATGDVSGDGIDDLLLCASGADYPRRSSAGIAYLILGAAGFFDSPVRDLGVAGTWHVRFIGPAAGGDMGGANAFGGLDAHGAAIGRLDNDNLGDVVLGVHLANGATTQSGRVYIVFGSSLPAAGSAPATFDLGLSSGHDVRINGDGQYDEMGDFVLTGDLTGDGMDELIIPNENFSQYLFDTEGAVHIFRGSASWNSVYNLATTSAPITLLGDKKYDKLGESATVGDFNGDGIVDLAAAAPGADAGAHTTQRGDGFVYGLLGSSGLQTGTHMIDYASATPDFLLIGEYQENLGTEISAGDFNGDGYDDIAGAEWFAGPQTNGTVEVLFGREFVGSPTFTAAVDTDLHIVGNANDRISFSMGAGDTNDDGIDEILYGTPFNNGSYPDEAGTVYVFGIVPGDVDWDGDIDVDDYWAFVAAYGQVRGAVAYRGEADLDGDGAIGLPDFQLWTQYYRTYVGDPLAPLPPEDRTGDFDDDGDVDLADFARLQSCYTGQNTGLEVLSSFCAELDTDADGDVDSADHGGFVTSMTDPR